ncbi:hypothetical protein ACFE04_001394 [Oxalis oulophora]
MGGGKRKPNNNNNDNINIKVKGRGSSGNNKKNNNKEVFVIGGILSDWQPATPSPPARGPLVWRDSNGKSNPGSKNSGGTKASSSKYAPLKSNGNEFGYHYPTVDHQEVLHSESPSVGTNNIKESKPTALLDSNDSQNLDMDQTPPPSLPQDTELTYDYSTRDGSHRELGFCEESETTPRGSGLSFKETKEKEKTSFDLSSPEKETDAEEDEDENVNSDSQDVNYGSHRGLGFCDESETTPRGSGLSFKETKEKERTSFDLSSPEKETDADEDEDENVNYDSQDVNYGSHRGLGFCDESETTPRGSGLSFKETKEKDLSSSGKKTDADKDEDVNCDSQELVTPPSKRNAGFISIGGLKLYTEDISDGENSEDGNDGSLDDESSDYSESEKSDGSSECDDESDSDSGSDIDEEVAKDYMKGISEGNTDLFGQGTDESDDDGSSSSSSSLDNTVKKLSGLALENASKEFGIQKKYSKPKRGSPNGRLSWSGGLDDLMLVKDPRHFSRKKHVAQNRQPWPSEVQKTGSSRSFPGEKKKHRKEMIAVKRRERMFNHGLDLGKINSKIEGLVLNGIDIFSFQPMHHRDCAQVRRLAAIYRLQSVCHGSGKKRFVTVSQTRHTCMPSPSDKIRLEKLIGADEDADFSVMDGPHKKSGSAKRRETKKIVKPVVQGDNKRQSGKRVSYTDQPMSFISAGVMHSETVNIKAIDSEEINNGSNDNCVVNVSQYASFEVHTKGFGSKMMAKMGFIEGGGLGKDGKGIAGPIEVTQRPKSLGLGASPSETDVDSGKKESSNNRNSTGREPRGNSKTRSVAPGVGGFEKHTKGFGSKMMAKMGFVEGTGLGRDSQGRVDPLVAVRRPRNRGLGSRV